MNKNYTHLSNHGPATADELPQERLTYAIRRDGVQRFTLTNTQQGDSLSGTGETKTVYYISGKHKPKAVIQKYLNENPQVQDALSSWAIHQRISEYGDEWIEASRELLGPFRDGIGGDMGGDGGKCPLCGEAYTGKLPDHLPCG